MKALGMIEVYGYLAAVEALDSALKAANVKMVEVTPVKGGLVAVMVTGDVGATGAAVAAAAAAAERVGRVVSKHVISKPAEDAARLLGKRPETGDTLPTGSDPTPHTGGSSMKVNFPEAKGEEMPIVEDSSAMKGLMEKKVSGMTVVELRKIARAMNLPGLTKHDIRFARKEGLIRAIEAHMEQGG